MGSPSEYDRQAALVARERELEKQRPAIARAADDAQQWGEAHRWMLRGVGLAFLVAAAIVARCTN